jgi:hypothetical protein
MSALIIGQFISERSAWRVRRRSRPIDLCTILPDLRRFDADRPESIQPKPDQQIWRARPETGSATDKKGNSAIEALIP